MALLLWEQTEVTGCVRVERLCLQDAGKNVRQAKTSWSPKGHQVGLKKIPVPMNKVKEWCVGGMNYHTQDKTEAFLPEKGRLMSHVPGL